MSGINLYAENNTPLLCTSCLAGYYLTNDKCCQNNFAWSINS